MEETVNQSACYLDRESPLRRLPQLVFAASQAWRQGGGEAQLGMAALPKAIGAKCSTCGFALSGAELLALAEISGGNEKSAMLKRLRAGQCACETCPSTHYRLLFFDVPPVSWEILLAAYRDHEAQAKAPAPPPPSEPLRPRPARSSRRKKIPLQLLGRISTVAGVCLLAWVWWRVHNGETIPVIRQPQHFRVATGPDANHHH